MLDAGDPAPDFFLSAVDDRDAEYMLSAAANAGPVVLAFVPDRTAAAIELLDALADLDWVTLADRIAVFGIGGSRDGLVQASADLLFPVLYDHERYVADLYGITDRESVTGTPRALFLVDGRCTIRFAWVESDPTEQPPLDGLADAIRSL